MFCKKILNAATKINKIYILTIYVIFSLLDINPYRKNGISGVTHILLLAIIKCVIFNSNLKKFIKVKMTIYNNEAKNNE
tara:strand:- start:12644 stop:12880 length:237 start_codon:yes stop_codon:yes gene_type:complete